jgi:xanthine dehydrogenase accessory factor
MELAALQSVNEERRARRAVVLLTDTQSGSARVIREHDQVEAELAEPIARAFRTGNSASAQVGERTYFLNVHLPEPRLVLIGAVHISQALAPMAKIAGLAVEIIDPRTAFASRERFPNVELKAEWPEDALAGRPLDAYTAVAALTHDPKIDDFALKAALDADCFYVGALGSRKTHARRVDRLAELGVSESEIKRINAPIGLDIGASSPAEIAVAILAQVIESLRFRGIARGGAA